MNITDYVVVLMRSCLPTDVIRTIINYVKIDLMEQINLFFLNQFMKSNRISFGLQDLPYPVLSIHRVQDYLNQYVLDNKLKIKMSHFDYKVNGEWCVCFFGPLRE